MKIISVIPARFGSKRIKDKNIVKLSGLPLIYYSIQRSLQSKLIEKTYFSTDSEKYRKIAVRYGALAPFIRPKKISKDHSSDLEFMQHLILYLEKKEKIFPEFIVHLRPTYPLREKGLIDKCINMLIKNKTFDSLRTVCSSKKNIEKMWYLRKNKLYNPITLNKELHSLPKEKLRNTYEQNNCIDILRTKSTIKKNSMTGKKILGFVMNHNFDIDNLQDLNFAKKNINKFNF